MGGRTPAGIALAFALLLLAGALGLRVLSLPRVPEAPEYRRVAFQVMGTVAQFSFTGDPELTQKAVEAGMAEFERVNRLCSIFDPESELSKLNATAANKPFACSPELWKLLQEARVAYEFSGGAFDITAKPLMDLWGFYRKSGDALPMPEAVADAQTRIGLDKVIFDDEKRTVSFPVSGMSFDLGGIAKGYAVDQAAEAALALGIRSGVVDLGGNLRLLPVPPEVAGHYRIGVRKPDGSGGVMDEILKLTGNMSLSTSGDYERFVEIGGARYGHIMDPVTGSPAPGGRGVTVLIPSALKADWLSTAIFIRGQEMAEKARIELGAQVLIVDVEKR